MSHVSNTNGFVKGLMEQIEKHKETVTDAVLAHLFDNILEKCPVEDGHAHEAWITALIKTNGKYKKLLGVTDSHNGKRSHDPTATKYGESDVQVSKTKTTVTVTNKLPFVYKLEYGLAIQVGDESGNQGKKINPVKRPPEKGPLYGGREQGSEGLLVFEKNGRLIKTRVWTPRGDDTGFVEKSVKETAAYVKSQGLIVKTKRI